jgi:predicted GIY-YIG superfamily endonuclease
MIRQRGKSWVVEAWDKKRKAKVHIGTFKTDAQARECEASLARCVKCGRPFHKRGSKQTQCVRNCGFKRGELRDGHHWVYRMYDANEVLLYVGITTPSTRRLHDHSKTAPWATEVATIKVDHVESREAALDREAKQIALLEPLHNRLRPILAPNSKENCGHPEHWTAHDVAVYLTVAVPRVKLSTKRGMPCCWVGDRLAYYLPEIVEYMAEHGSEL